MPPVPASTPADDSLERIATEIAACRACGLCASRRNTVPGEGPARCDLVFVGEGPGADEDASGRPFVGAAGALLDSMIKAMGLARGEVFIANVLKCRPPGNRTPEPAEMAACLGYLHRQLALLRPRVVCTLGNTPLRALTGDLGLGITSQRGKVLRYGATPLLPTFHPAYLLRNPQAKKLAWEDLKQVLGLLGRPVPGRS